MLTNENKPSKQLLIEPKFNNYKPDLNKNEQTPKKKYLTEVLPFEEENLLQEVING